MTTHTTPPFPSRPPREPQVRARHEKIELIGSGGMAAVWKAWRVLGDGSRQLVAIKELRQDVRGNLETITRFCREAKFCMEVIHENVVRVFDLIKADEHYQIVMEYVDGVTLEQLIEADLQLPVRVHRFILGQLVNGLDALHRKRLLHRDLSPMNVMLTRDGTLKLIDLGVAKDLAGPVTTGGCLGTLPFASPEVLRSEPGEPGQRGSPDEQLDESSDLYSVGAILYYCLTRKPPVSGRTREAILAQHEASEVATAPDVLPGDLRQLLDGLLQPRTERAFRHAREIAWLLMHSTSQEPDYIATREELSICVQSVMSDLANNPAHDRSGTTEIFENLPDGRPGDDKGLPGDAALESLSGAIGAVDSMDAIADIDDIDDSALLDVIRYCFSDRASVDERAEALREMLAVLHDQPEQSEQEPDSAEPGLEVVATPERPAAADDATRDPPATGKSSRQHARSWVKRVVAAAVVVVCIAISVWSYRAHDTRPDDDGTSALWTDPFYPAERGERK